MTNKYTPLLLALLMAVLAPAAAKDRIYYLAAEDVLWDYTPSYPLNVMTGKAFTDEQRSFVAGNGKDRIGSKYLKGRYVAYTSASFTYKIKSTIKNEHLGILGPTIFANVGDTVVVHFKNKTADKWLSIHPHGVFYNKANEGSGYNDASTMDDKQDDAVAPGQTYTYTWQIPQRAGPGSGDSNSVVWLYHSHVNSIADTNAGFVGAMVIAREDERDSTGKLAQVDREFIAMFTVFDENASLYAGENIAQFAPNADPADGDFIESNLMHAINGYMYGNLPGLAMTVGEKVRWYQVALGTEVDLHTPHWHGATLLTTAGNRVDVVNLLPATQITLDMTPDNPGIWMYHCHINDHITAGMMAKYLVRQATENSNQSIFKTLFDWL